MSRAATKNLVIVESPAKAATIERYLGSDYTVIASYGHIRDLPQKSRRAAKGAVTRIVPAKKPISSVRDTNLELIKLRFAEYRKRLRKDPCSSP